MARPRKTRKINHDGNRTRMDDLDDHMLTQILLRLPNCATVLACSLVNKRWCSLISDPNFANQFANHKNKTTTLLNGSGFDHEDKEPSWTLVIRMVESHTTLRDIMTDKAKWITEFLIPSPKLSLEFLPFKKFIVMATFKDLVLCSCDDTEERKGRFYCITNPLTKQWVALPPCPPDDGKLKECCTLICQSPYNHTRDYKFRVVWVCWRPKDFSLSSYDLVVYCSEIGEWKEINLRVPKEMRRAPQIVVCNGIVYFKSGLCLVALNPFDVNDTCDTTLDARVMPPLPDFGYLKESKGQLLVVHTPNSSLGVPYLLSTREHGTTDIELEMEVWKLDMNQTPFAWETTFQGLCKGTWNSIKLSRRTRLQDIVVHPYNDKLIYMHLNTTEQQFVLCDTRTGCITLSRTFPNYYVSGFHRVEQQWWPTSVPALAQCLTST